MKNNSKESCQDKSIKNGKIITNPIISENTEKFSNSKKFRKFTKNVLLNYFLLI